MTERVVSYYQTSKDQTTAKHYDSTVNRYINEYFTTRKKSEEEEDDNVTLAKAKYLNRIVKIAKKEGFVEKKKQKKTDESTTDQTVKYQIDVIQEGKDEDVIQDRADPDQSEMPIPKSERGVLVVDKGNSLYRQK